MRRASRARAGSSASGWRVRLTETGELADVVLYASAVPAGPGDGGADRAGLRGRRGARRGRFGEHDPGPDSDGLTFDEFIARHGMPDWESDAHAVTFPGGETLAELHHRVGIAVRDVVTAHPGRTIVVCCHGGVVNAVLRMALRTPTTGGFELFTTNASLTELLLVRPGRWRLRALQRRRPPRRPAARREAAARRDPLGGRRGRAAGCVVAARLAEVPGNDVTLVEAGPARRRCDAELLRRDGRARAAVPRAVRPGSGHRRVRRGQRDGRHARRPRPVRAVGMVRRR